MKNKLIFFITAAFLILLLPVTAKAEGDKFKDDKCVVPFDLYVSCDGQEEFLRSGYGILVGLDSDGGASNMIANAFDIRATNEELQAFYDRKAIEEDKRDSAKSVVKIMVEKDIQVEAAVNNISESMNLAVLNCGQKIYNHNSVIFDVDDDSIKPAQELYILDSESNYHVGYAVNESMINGIKYVQFDSPRDSEQRGQAVFDEDEEFIGMIQDSVDGTHKNALSSKEIAVALKTLGIQIEVADHTVKPVDKQALIAATDMAEKIDLTLYTEETAALMREQIQKARSVIISSEATQEEVDETFNNLNSAQDNLIVEKKIGALALVFIIVSGVLLLGIIIFVAVMIIIRKSKKRKEKARAELEAKRAPTYNGPYIPSANKNKKESSDSGVKSEYLTRVRMSEELDEKETPSSGGSSEKLSSLTGFAPSSKAITFNEEDTTVLSAVEDNECGEEEIVHAHLILCSNGDRIDINKDIFVIGKSIQKADYVIDNQSVSRAHLSIIFKAGSFFAKDLSSLNGSFVNDVKINPEEETEIKNEDVIKLADAEMKFYID